jgi:hypothetical protein
MLIYVSMNNPFSKINPGAIPGSISFMHGLKSSILPIQLPKIKNNRNRNVKYKSVQHTVFKLAYRTSEKNWESNINNLDLPLQICRQGFNG